MSPSLWSAAPAAGLALGVVLGCGHSDSEQTQPECIPVQFRGCEAECGRGVQQCFDTEGTPHWGACACVVLDASLPTPAGGVGGVAGAAEAAGHGGLEAGGHGGGPATLGCGGASGAAGAVGPCPAGGAAGEGGSAGGANRGGAAGNGGEAN